MTANSVERWNLAVSVQVPLGRPDWHLGKENCHRRMFKGRGQELEQASEILCMLQKRKAVGECQIQ